MGAPSSASTIITVVFGAARFPLAPALDNELMGRAFSCSRRDVTVLLRSFSRDTLDLFDAPHSPSDLCREFASFIRDRPWATDLIVYYVGHGGFLDDQSYFLALSETETNQEHTTGLRAVDLAATLRGSFRKGRTFLVLDCCFAGSVVPLMQGALEDLLEQQVATGVAVLNASSKDKAAIVPRGAERTMFSDCLYDVLSGGLAGASARLSLRQVKAAVTRRIAEKYPAEVKAWPEVHTPRQQGADIADYPLFPNLAWRREGSGDALAEESLRLPSTNGARPSQRAFREWKLALLGVLMLSSIAYWLFFGTLRGIVPETRLRAARIPKGTYEHVINHLERKLNAFPKELGFSVVLDNVVSEGSIQTIDQIRTGAVDIGIVQANCEVPRDHCGAIGTLYKEVYLFFTRLTPSVDFYALAQSTNAGSNTFRVACLGKGSQSFADLTLIFEHYGFFPTKIEVVPGNYEQSLQRLSSGAVDAAFFVTGLQSQTVRTVARMPGVRLMDFPDADGLLENMRGVAKYQVPSGTFGAAPGPRPPLPVQTLFTPAVLVASTNLNNETIRRLTGTLLDHRAEIGSGMPLLDIEPLSPALGVPAHPGAEAFLEKRSPFFVAYRSLLQLLLSILVFLVSLAIACRDVIKRRTRSRR